MYSPFVKLWAAGQLAAILLCAQGTITLSGSIILKPGAPPVTFSATCTVNINVAPAVVTDPLDPSLRPLASGGATPNVWITGPLAKVLQVGGAPGPLHAAMVYAAKNEIASFQAHVQATTPIKALNVVMSDLVNAQTGTKILAASTDIVVFREAYMNVTIPTATGATFFGTTGQYPDILIPAVDPYYHQVTNAFPVAVAQGNNQSVWVDVHIPPTAPSGYYGGTVTVSDGATVLATMPVLYAVWNWSMPSTATLASYTSVSYGGFCFQVYGPTGCINYPGSLGFADYGVTLANADAAAQMLDNRYTLAGITNIYPAGGSFSPPQPANIGGASFDLVYGPLLSGTPGRVPQILQGAKFTSFGMQLLPSQVSAASFQQFQQHFAAQGWVTPFYFLVDEPDPNNPAVWPPLIAGGNQAHSFAALPTASTTDLVTATKYSAQNAIDWLIVNIGILETGGGSPLQDLSAYKAWLAANPARRFWSYLSCFSAGTCGNGTTGTSAGRPNALPNYDIDGTPVANRVMEWLTYLHGQTGELYYYIDICDGPNGAANACGLPSVGINMNPIKTVYYSGGWGDGTLMYPGSSAYVGTKIPIWLPSMRLKMIRDGMQDYEYLNAVGPTLAMQQIKTFIINSYTFSTDPAALESARMAMGSSIHKASLAP